MIYILPHPELIKAMGAAMMDIAAARIKTAQETGNVPPGNAKVVEATQLIGVINKWFAENTPPLQKVE